MYLWDPIYITLDPIFITFNRHIIIIDWYKCSKHHSNLKKWEKSYFELSISNINKKKKNGIERYFELSISNINENKKRGVERYFELSISNINYVYRIMQLCSTLFCVSVLECKWFLLKNVSINKSDFSFEINSLGRSSIDYYIRPQLFNILYSSSKKTHHGR